MVTIEKIEKVERLLDEEGKTNAEIMREAGVSREVLLGISLYSEELTNEQKVERVSKIRQGMKSWEIRKIMLSS